MVSGLELTDMPLACLFSMAVLLNGEFPIKVCLLCELDLNPPHCSHAPSVCPEDEACKAVVTLRCECGRLTQPASCGSSSANPVSRGHGKFQLKCNQDCAVAKRNRNLAEALGIDAAKTTKFPVEWPEALVSTFRVNSAFGLLVEKTFNE